MPAVQTARPEPWALDLEFQVDEPERVNAWFKQQIKIVDDAQKQQVAKMQESVQVTPRLRTVMVETGYG
jgi:hypothetical protein